MIWTIFRKDFRLLWPAAAVMAALQVGLAAFEMMKRAFGDLTYQAENWVSNSVLIGVAGLVVLTVQQDALLGMEQDWLVRPIRRGRLLMAKLLFLGAALHLPMFLIDMAVCLHAGGYIGQSLGAALSRNLLVFLTVTLPLAGAAAITPNIAAFAAVMLVYYVGLGVISTLVGVIRFGDPAYFANTGSGPSWIISTAKDLILILGGGLVVGLQYFQRRTLTSRIVLPLSVLIGLMMPLLPWKVVYAVQQIFSPVPEAAHAISFGPLPDAPRAHGTFNENATPVFVPFQVSGLGEGERLFVDLREITIVSADGKKIAEGSHLFGIAGDVNVDSQTPAQTILDPARSYVGFDLDKKDSAVLDQPGSTLIVDYALTLGAREGEDVVTSLSRKRTLVPGWGRCLTQNESTLPPLVLQCISVGAKPGLNVLSAYSSDSERPYASGALQDYSPISAEVMPDALNRYGPLLFTMTLDPTRQSYPNPRIAITHYRPLAHFRYQLVIRDLKLSNWVLLPNPKLPH